MPPKSKKNVQDFPSNLSRPALDALEVAGYTSLAQLTKVTEREIGKLHGMGPKGVEMLRAALIAKGWSFAEDKSDRKHK